MVTASATLICSMIRSERSGSIVIGSYWLKKLFHWKFCSVLYSTTLPSSRLRKSHNLAGHLSHDLLPWLFHNGIMPLYTPLGGSWLKLAESLQRIIVRRALAGQHPQQAQEVIDWLEQTVAGWNVDPTPFVWGGKRHARRVRARLRRLGGSGAALVKGYSIAA